MSRDPNITIIAVDDLNEIENDRNIVDGFDNNEEQIITFEIYDPTNPQNGSSLSFSNKVGHFMLDTEVRVKNGKLDGNQSNTSYSEDGKIRTNNISVYEDGEIISEQSRTLDFENNNVVKYTALYGHVPWSSPNIEGLKTIYDPKNGSTAEFQSKDGELNIEKTLKLKEKINWVNREDKAKFFLLNLIGISDKELPEVRHKMQAVEAAERIAPKNQI